MKNTHAVPGNEIAVYGKGGIGKSTISANLSAALSLAGKKVLQIGCDPKHDSTRLLLRGNAIPTVLDSLRDIPEDSLSVSDILFEGWNGIGCIEAGGPRPGVGCAGRGIISAFEFLKKNRVKENYDLVIYDVLGDVVCGGFAVPIRREYADTVILVTSGEYMSLYAANNILRGILNYDGSKYKRVAGIIFNERLLPDESERVRRFSDAVSLPVIARIPRSDAFSKAEEHNLPLPALGAFHRETEIFETLAGKICAGLTLYSADPLSDEELEEAVLFERFPKRKRTFSFSKDKKTPSSLSIPADEKKETFKAFEDGTKPMRRPPLYGCAFNGAATTAVCLSDAAVIAHAPKACAYYTWQNITSPGRKSLFNRGVLLPSAMAPYFSCTDMTRTEAVYGGIDKLRRAVSEAAAKKPGAVIVISSCVSGIIGDDVISVEDMSTPDVPVIVIPADGDIAGDYMTGIRMCMRTLAKSLIDTATPPSEKSVNIIGEIPVSDNLEANHRALADILDKLGISINCRFLGHAKTSELRGFMKGRLNILASESADNLELKQWLENEFGCGFLDVPLPIGFNETKTFVNKLASFFSCEDKASSLLDKEEEEYNKRIGELRKRLEGRRVLIMTISTNMDWLFSAASDAGAKIVWAGVADYLGQGINISKDPEIMKVTEAFYDVLSAESKIAEYRPDIVVSNYISAVAHGDYVLDNMPMTQRQGFFSGIYVLERWAFELEHMKKGEWIDDRELFQKYYT